MDNQACNKLEEISQVSSAISVISGKWKPTILIYLRYAGTMRFGELRRQMPGVTQKMVTAQLRELERDGIVIRKIYAEIPPRVEYSLSDYGKTLIPIIDAMHDWGRSHRAQQKPSL